MKAVEGKFTEWEETLIISMNQGYRFFDLAWYEEAGEKDLVVGEALRIPINEILE